MAQLSDPDSGVADAPGCASRPAGPVVRAASGLGFWHNSGCGGGSRQRLRTGHRRAEGHPGRDRRFRHVAAGRGVRRRAGPAARGPPGLRLRGAAVRPVRRVGGRGSRRDRRAGTGARRDRGRPAAAGRGGGREPGRAPHLHHRGRRSVPRAAPGRRRGQGRRRDRRRVGQGRAPVGRDHWPSGWSRPAGGRSPWCPEAAGRRTDGRGGGHRGGIRAGPGHRRGAARRGLAGRAGGAAGRGAARDRGGGRLVRPGTRCPCRPT